MSRLLLYLPLLLITLSSCNKYKIEGSASDARLDGRMLFIKMLGTDRAWKSIDSCEVVHGEFSMRGTIDSITMATLFMDDMPILPMVLEKGTIKIKISNQETRVSGTTLNNALYGFLDKQNELQKKVEDLLHKESQMILNGEDPDEAYEMINREGQKLSDDMKKIVVDFITDNFDNVLARGVFLLIANNMTYPMITPEIQQIMDKAPASFKDNAMVKEFMTAAEENMKRMRLTPPPSPRP